MEKNKSIFWLISLRLILLLIIVCPLLFVVGCKETSNNVNVKTNDISTQSTEPEQEEPEPTPIDFAVSWQLSSDFQQSGLNIYTSTYTGQDLLAGVNVDDDLNGLISIIVEYNGEVVTKITNAGEYVITAQYDGEDYVLSNNVIIVDIAKANTSLQWLYSVDNSVTWNELLNNKEVTYNGNAVQIRCTNNFSGEVVDYSGGFVVSKGTSTGVTIRDVGEYVITPQIDLNEVNLNYTNLTPLTINIVPATVVCSWKYYVGDNSTNKLELINDQQMVYCAQDVTVVASYMFNNTECLVPVSITNVNDQAVAKIRNVGIYKIKATNNNSDNLIMNNTTISLEIVKKEITVVVNDVTINYSENIPNNIGFVVYDSYDATTGQGTVLQNWSETIQGSTRYTLEDQPISVAEINSARNSWVYSEEDNERNYVAYVDFIEVDNYDVKLNVPGSLTIKLKEISVSLYKDNAKVTTKTCFQAQLAGDLTDSWLTELGQIDNTVSGWYIEKNELVDGYKFKNDTRIDCYSIYRVYYMKQVGDTVDKNINKVEIKFHKNMPVRIPSVNHITEEPTQYAYNLSGWMVNSKKYTYNTTQTTSSLNVDGDLYLYPVFEPKQYNIILNKYAIDNNDPETKEKPISSKSLKTYTILDYDNQTVYSLTNERSEIEGYQFKGWYYNNKQIGNDFKVSDFVTRDKLDLDDNGRIIIEARYELYKCNVTLVVGGKTITSVTYEPGAKINENYFNSLIDRKFGYIYIISDIPEEANASVIVINVTEVPFIWILLGIGFVTSIIVLIVVKVIKKRKGDNDKKKFDVILNRLDQ